MSTRKFFKGGWTYDHDPCVARVAPSLFIPRARVSVVLPPCLFNATPWNPCPAALRRDGFPAAPSFRLSGGRRIVKAPGRRGKFETTRIAPPGNPYPWGEEIHAEEILAGQPHRW